jgi:phosphoglycolate phosphatase-like HAD superfamily hydrolase
MDVIFDIDGTLADATHRLHHIVEDPNQIYEHVFKKNWDRFLSDELVAQDAYIEPMWKLLAQLDKSAWSILFITGRPEAQRDVTWTWLKDGLTRHRAFRDQRFLDWNTRLYMRDDGDRRPSHKVKRDSLRHARNDGFDPKLVFEDRKDDTAMWRSEGLICCQVAEGNY